MFIRKLEDKLFKIQAKKRKRLDPEQDPNSDFRLDQDPLQNEYGSDT